MSLIQETPFGCCAARGQNIIPSYTFNHLYNHLVGVHFIVTSLCLANTMYCTKQTSKTAQLLNNREFQWVGAIVQGLSPKVRCLVLVEWVRGLSFDDLRLGVGE